MELLRTELDLFEPRAFQRQITHVEEITLQPYTALNNSPTIEFVIPRNDKYIDLNSVRLKLIIELKKTKKTKKGDDKKTGETSEEAAVATINNLISSIFSKVSVYLNSVLINAEDTNYPYKSYLETLLFYNKNHVSFLQNQGFYFDEPIPSSTKKNENNGYEARKKLLSDSNKIEIIGPIHVDFFRTHNKFLLNLIDLRLTLTRESPDFYIWCENDDSCAAFIQIHEACLMFNQITLSPEIYLSHNKILNTYNKRAIYPYFNNLIKTHLINSGVKTASFSGINSGNILPKLVLITFISHKVYTGNKNSNSFLFNHFNLSEIYLVANGRQIPTNMLQLDCDNHNQFFARAYDTLYKELNYSMNARTHMIDREIFLNNQFVLAFNLCHDQYPAYSEVSGPTEMGHLEVHCKFRDELKETVTCLLYLNYPAQLEIDSERNIYITQ